MVSLKEREMAVSGLTSEEWEAEAAEAARARALARARYALENIITEEMEDVALGALYHAGKLVFGCAERPKTVIPYGSSKSHFGERYTPHHTWPESSSYQQGIIK